MRPTPAGEAFLRHARAILAEARVLDANIGEFAGGLRGRVRLLSNTNALTEFLPAALGRFLAAHPDVGVLVEERLSHAVARGLLDGEADLGIVAGTAELRGLDTFPFARDRLVLVVPRHAVPPGGAPVAFADVLDQPFVGLDEASAIQAFLAEAAAKAGRRLKLRMRLRSFEAVCLMVEAGAGLAVVPRSAALRYAATMAVRYRGAGRRVVGARPAAVRARRGAPGPAGEVAVGIPARLHRSGRACQRVADAAVWVGERRHARHAATGRSGLPT